MFDIVASNNHELALPVEVEGIDGPKPRRPGPPITWQPNPAPEDEAENKGQQTSGGEERDRRSGKGETLAREKSFIQAWHLSDGSFEENCGGRLFSVACSKPPCRCGLANS
jgi:hypothetical protein